MELSKCRICGERHRLGGCPESATHAKALGDAKRREKNETDNRSTVSKADKSPSRTAVAMDASASPQGHGRTAVTKLKRGRPTITAPRPWDSEGMSRRTWYRRRAEGKEK